MDSTSRSKRYIHPLRNLYSCIDAKNMPFIPLPPFRTVSLIRLHPYLGPAINPIDTPRGGDKAKMISISGFRVQSALGNSLIPPYKERERKKTNLYPIPAFLTLVFSQQGPLDNLAVSRIAKPAYRANNLLLLSNVSKLKCLSAIKVKSLPAVCTTCTHFLAISGIVSLKCTCTRYRSLLQKDAVIVWE